MSQRQVKNQFNISSSVIGQLAIGNKGQTVYNQETKRECVGYILHTYIADQTITVAISY